MSSSSWAKKLETKLSALSESSSKESIQTLAKWVGFNRKHGGTFGEVLSKRIANGSNNNNNSSSATVALSVIHQVLLLDKDNSTKWDKLSDLRVALGETALLPNAAQLQQHHSTAVSSYLKEWDTSNVFGGPTLVNQLKRQMAAATTTTSGGSATTTPTTTKPSAVASKSKAATVEAETAKEAPIESKDATKDASATSGAPEKAADAASDTKESAVASKQIQDKTTAKDKQATSSTDAATTSATTTAAAKPSRRSSLALQQQQAHVYDMESKGIPPAPVQMKELQDPCRSVATLQIARDLRNDSAQQLSGILAELPEAVQALIETAKQQQQEPKTSSGSSEGTPTSKELELGDDKARDLSIQTNEAAIDLDVSEQLSNIRMFRDIIEKQRQARTLLIHLLIKSRCQFGAQDAAQAFGESTRAAAELQRRKQVLLDAMDLEGLELPKEDKTRTDEADAALAEAEKLTLEWHTRTAAAATDGGGEPSAAKKAKTQDES